MAGKLDWRPKANKMAKGNATTKLTLANSKVSGRPPQRAVST